MPERKNIFFYKPIPLSYILQINLEFFYVNTYNVMYNTNKTL